MSNFVKANEMFRRGNVNSAMKMYKEIIADNTVGEEDKKRVMYNLAVCYIYNEEYNVAYELLKGIDDEDMVNKWRANIHHNIAVCISRIWGVSDKDRFDELYNELLTAMYYNPNDKDIIMAYEFADEMRKAEMKRKYKK